ncbi:hypothetical protein GH714_029559 [Hevea brasiliensis]|uniref:Uncharacterized protein n=1 Tax=Hevea brasiliensis TaxID=3981 RepID=A0A6A6K7F3_HEVBR|nr:hypothetical protein GH714_029559 [Hevea brasiliensis]
MLESPAPAAQPDSTTVVKRYAPPNQRQAFFAFYLFVWYLLRNPNMRNKLAFLELNVDFLTVVNINVFAAKMKILSTVIFPKHGKVLCIKQLSYRFDRSNSLYASDAEKNQQFAPPRNLPIVDHVDVGSSNVLNENSRPGLISLDGCCRSEASQLLNDRWALAMHNYNDDSIDLSDSSVATFIDCKISKKSKTARIKKQKKNYTAAFAVRGACLLLYEKPVSLTLRGQLCIHQHGSVQTSSSGEHVFPAMSSFLSLSFSHTCYWIAIQFMSPANSGGPGSQMDFLSELRRAIHDSSANPNN